MNGHYDELETGICVSCGRSHVPANRKRLIAPMVGEVTFAHEIAEVWPCFYDWTGGWSDWWGSAGERRLWRDLQAIRSSRPNSRHHEGVVR